MPCNGLINLDKKLYNELDETLHQEELKWCQKSMEEWIQLSDRNTKFYHASTMVRRDRNRIRGLKDVNDVWINDKDQLEAMIQDYYKKLYSTEELCDMREAMTEAFPRIEEGHWNVLNKEITKNEVKEALMSTAPLKALSPDGFHVMFYQKSWDIVGDNMHNLVIEFFNHGHLLEGLNDTNIVLIPKVQHPEKVTQLRPISLCNIAYKLVTKVMTNRLKGVMPKLICLNQSSFVPKRQITDNIVIYQEILRTIRMSKSKPGYMVLKIDIEKAYNRLDWGFICSTL